MKIIILLTIITLVESQKLTCGQFHCAILKSDANKECNILDCFRECCDTNYHRCNLNHCKVGETLIEGVCQIETCHTQCCKTTGSIRPDHRSALARNKAQANFHGSRIECGFCTQENLGGFLYEVFKSGLKILAPELSMAILTVDIIKTIGPLVACEFVIRSKRENVLCGQIFPKCYNWRLHNKGDVPSCVSEYCQVVSKIIQMAVKESGLVPLLTGIEKTFKMDLGYKAADKTLKMICETGVKKNQQKKTNHQLSSQTMNPTTNSNEGDPMDYGSQRAEMHHSNGNTDTSHQSDEHV